MRLWRRSARHARRTFSGRPWWRWPTGVLKFLRVFKWWQLYLALLVLSIAWQLVFPTAPWLSGVDVDGTVEVPELTAAGPTDEQTVRIGYRVYGDPGAEETIIALHGSPAGFASFEVIGPMLGERYRVIAPDLPGYGRSSKWVDDYGCRAYARYALAMMDELGIESAHLLGFSLGGGVAYNIYDLAPDRVESIVNYAGIGIQAGEGSGDYGFEHFKYNVGYAVYVAGVELVPHFGLLGGRAFRHAFMRNFMDTDQRPIRGVLDDMSEAEPKTPLLLLHGKDDPLVPAKAARWHHRLVEHSELVMFDGSHFMLFGADSARELADEIVPFVDRASQPAAAPSRRTVDPFAEEVPEPLDGKNALGIRETMGPWVQVLVIMGGTFVSEDLTCITVGMLANRHQIDLFLGVMACFLGIFLGDIALWMIGHVGGRTVLRWRPIARWVPTRQIDELADWFDRYGFVAVFASRFMPGTRLPLYTTAGVVGGKAHKFIVWALVSDLIYTPIIVIVVAIFGRVLAAPLERYFENTWLAAVIGAVVLFIGLRVLFMSMSYVGRRRLWAMVSRVRRWEFWPMWLFYAPLVPWLAWLSLRYRGATTFTAANPGIPQSGLVGESKWQVLKQLPQKHVIPGAMIDAGEPAERMAAAERAIAANQWAYPMIVKPDVGQRGAGVKRVRTPDALEQYLADWREPVLLQTYHPGPYEAGVFYVRHPDEEVGRIFSITDKTFPKLLGDGERTLEELIWSHPRYRMQASKFLHRFGDHLDRVPDEGETVSLAISGNHCQGTMFTDGSHLVTPELEATIESIARHVRGFHFGRFDVRYADPERFKAGRDLRIVELNGVTSESTNLWDPDWTLLRAYATLFEQWRLAYAIGLANRRRGAPHTGTRGMIRLLWNYYRHRSIDPVGD